MIAAFIGGGEIILLMAMLFIIPFALALFAFWIWMLISAIQNKGLNEGEKIAWVLVIALLHLLGAIIYFFVGHPKRKMPLVV
ncbi:MAG: PLDc N-terminal domain-containing protein [Verrucomicrobiales bacterium]|nr:PLDc N-terminal domain-containing protein [Verrucomicrobiales bacterium]